MKARKEEPNETYREKIDEIDSKLDAKIQTMRGWFMLWAVLLPPIPPLLLAGFVFIVRRSRAREGVASAAALRISEAITVLVTLRRAAFHHGETR